MLGGSINSSMVETFLPMVLSVVLLVRSLVGTLVMGLLLRALVVWRVALLGKLTIVWEESWLGLLLGGRFQS